MISIACCIIRALLVIYIKSMAISSPFHTYIHTYNYICYLFYVTQMDTVIRTYVRTYLYKIIYCIIYLSTALAHIMYVLNIHTIISIVRMYMY